MGLVISLFFLYFTSLAYNETNNPESNFKRNYFGK